MSRLKMLTLVVCAAAAAACSNNTTTAPTTPTVSTITDTYSGTLNQNGAASFTFTTSQSGNIQATLTALAPDSAVLVGLSLGTWNGTSCQIVLANDKATQFSSITGTVSSSGSLCVRIYDVGKIVDPTTYEIQVIHF